MKKVLFSVIIILSLILSPHSWGGTGDPIIEGKTATLTGTATGNATKTTATWSKTIGSASDYATWAAMIADMPDLIAHAVTITIKAGTTLSETCELKNKHGLVAAAAVTIQAEKYFPTSGAIPTADSATATTLRDSALAAAALGDDYFNGCWVFIVHGTGTDNGFVAITDYVDATGDVVVASWPGTQPDNTSRYIIVGALVDGEATRKTIDYRNNTCSILIKGVGFTNDVGNGTCSGNSEVTFYYCGIDKAVSSGIEFSANLAISLYYCGIVDNNSSNSASHGGLKCVGNNSVFLRNCGISDNLQRGIYATSGGFVWAYACFGDSNGTWGVWARASAQVRIVAPECSGSSGNHSDPGTAGNANADQAAAY